MIALVGRTNRLLIVSAWAWVSMVAWQDITVRSLVRSADGDIVGTRRPAEPGASF